MRQRPKIYRASPPKKAAARGEHATLQGERTVNPGRAACGLPVRTGIRIGVAVRPVEKMDR